jgi:hypothetical protein
MAVSEPVGKFGERVRRQRSLKEPISRAERIQGEVKQRLVMTAEWEGGSERDK